MSAGESTKEQMTAPIVPMPEEPAAVESVESAPAPTPAPMPTPAPVPEQAYPSVPKWEGLWKYVVKHGDDVMKIAKQVGVTLEMLKAANPQLAHTLHLDKIYPGQVLNIPSTGMKPKSTAGMTKEQLTAPVLPFPKEHYTSPKEHYTAPKEHYTSPKEMVTMEKTIHPLPMPTPQMPMVMPHLDLNLQYAPHKDIHKEYNTNINWQQQNIKGPAAPQMVSGQQIMPEHHHMHHHPMILMYIPVSTKKKHCCKKKCHKKCGCHHKTHHHMYDPHMHQHMLMASMYNQQSIGMMPKTFYRDED